MYGQVDKLSINTKMDERNNNNDDKKTMEAVMDTIMCIHSFSVLLLRKLGKSLFSKQIILHEANGS